MSRKQHWSEREYEGTREGVAPPLEPAAPTPNPSAPKPTPARSADDILRTYRTNLEWAVDCAAIKLTRLKPGSSACKTQAGVLRGLQQALGALDSEMGACHDPR